MGGPRSPDGASGIPSDAAVAWGLVGTVLLFGAAIVRLGGRGLATIREGLHPAEWAALLVLIALFVYGEGYRALQRAWVPFLLRRLRSLREERRTGMRVLAPLYALGLVGAPTATLLRAWLGTGAIAVAVILVRLLPEPWRGITDVAVTAALAWGLAAILVRARSLFR